MPRLLVIGAGTAGIAAARAAAARGWEACLVHAGLPLGGCCLNVGCVPSKYLIRAAERVYHASHPGFPGLAPAGIRVDSPALLAGAREKITLLRRRNYEDPLPGEPGIECVEGRGRLIDARTVAAGERMLRGDAVLIATGSRPWTAPVPGLDRVPLLTNETLFALERLPGSVIVLGGGYIALEMAQMLHRLGVRVVLIQRSAHVLSSQPSELGESLTGFFREEGMEIHCGTQVLETIPLPSGGVRLRFLEEGREITVEAEALFSAMGREGNTGDLGLTAAGIALTGRGFVRVDEQYQTTLPGVYAAGDVLGGHLLVYTASAEAERVVAHLCGESIQPIAPEEVPWVVFTDPQVAGVGLDTDTARRAGMEVDEAVLPVNRWPRFSTLHEERGFLKLIRDRKSGRLAGARAICPEAGDLMTELAWILRRGIPLREVADSLAPYLTLSEGIQKCAARFPPL